MPLKKKPNEWFDQQSGEEHNSRFVQKTRRALGGMGFIPPYRKAQSKFQKRFMLRISTVLVKNKSILRPPVRMPRTLDTVE